ncbi:unnamed protein product [Ambrosiozyma monospora]|uniref:Unnamed protein product n=1 Tax=Ambrosiozyma monospora TaxID=43982 RepID=A0A9W6YS05_AMBMO|nr:unnamed protein product [Ambrosiozyma monospora]
MAGKLAKTGIFIGSTIVSYMALDYQLCKMYPNIPMDQIPPSSQFRSTNMLKLKVKPSPLPPLSLSDNSTLTSIPVQEQEQKTYIAYTDNYKQTLHNVSLDEATHKILSFSIIKWLFTSNSPPPSTSISEIQSTPTSKPVMTKIPIAASHSKDNKTKSYTIKWFFDNSLNGIVPFFEKLSKDWYYPYRLMNGGYHEVLISENPNNAKDVDVYFLTAHEYNDLRSQDGGQVIPGWCLNLHRNYARLILYFGTR